MARALHTLVLTRAGLSAPELSSTGVWSPDRDAHLWLKFCLRAHHFQAQSVAARMERAAIVWEMLDAVGNLHKLPERTMELLFSAMVGFRVRRSTYVRTAEIDERSATRDFKRLAATGLLRAVGETKVGYCVAGEGLDEIVAVRRGNDELVEPYPGFRGALYS